MRDGPCPDCGVVLKAHVSGCLTYAVERDLMTPRQRQVVLYEREEAAREEAVRCKDVLPLLDAQISQVGFQGGRPSSIVMGTNVWRRLMQGLPNGTTQRPSRLDPAGGQYMGLPVHVDRTLPPDDVFVLGKDNDNFLAGSAQVYVGLDPAGPRRLSMDEVAQKFQYLGRAANWSAAAITKINGLAP